MKYRLRLVFSFKIYFYMVCVDQYVFAFVFISHWLLPPDFHYLPVRRASSVPDGLLQQKIPVVLPYGSGRRLLDILARNGSP